MATRVMRMPEHYGELSPLLHVVPLQLLALGLAGHRRRWRSPIEDQA